MNGLLLKILDDSLRSPATSFKRFFAPIIPSLNSHYLVFDCQPWMGLPVGGPWEKWDDSESSLCLYFDERVQSSIQLWRPGTLERYHRYFGEEYIDFWAIDQSQEDPAFVASEYSRLNWSRIIRDRYAAIRLHYHDSSCWEVYCTEASSKLVNLLADRVGADPTVQVIKANSDQRNRAFKFAGLNELVDSGMIE